MNRKDECNAYRRGSESVRFSSEEAVEKAAIAVWRSKFPKAVALVVGSYAVAEPQRVLDGDDPVASQLRDYWQRWESLGEDWNPSKSELCDSFWEYATAVVR